MKNIVMTLTVAVALTVLGGCSHMNYSLKSGGMAMSGESYHPVAMTRAASDAYTQAYNAQTYRIAVERGYAYPYAGGGYSNDYWYYYRNIVPQQPVAPAPPVASNGAASNGGRYATKAQLDQVRRRADDAHQRADDALRMDRRLRDTLERGASH